MYPNGSHRAQCGRLRWGQHTIFIVLSSNGTISFENHNFPFFLRFCVMISWGGTSIRLLSFWEVTGFYLWVRQSVLIKLQSEFISRRRRVLTPSGERIASNNVIIEAAQSSESSVSLRTLLKIFAESKTTESILASFIIKSNFMHFPFGQNQPKTDKHSTNVAWLPWHYSFFRIQLSVANEAKRFSSETIKR